MPCVAPKSRTTTSCRGYDIGDEHAGLAKVLCPYCRRLRDQGKAALSLQKKRELDRVASIRAVAKQPAITGASLQKQVTAITEQVLIDLFEECTRGGTPPADFALMACGSVARREMVTFSDVDAVLILSSEDDKVLDYFTDVNTRMALRLQVAGERNVMRDGKLAPTMGSGFTFCPMMMGLNPKNYFGTPQTIIDKVLLADPEDKHLRGALFPRLIYGSEIWAKQYQDACGKALKKDAGNIKRAAVNAIRDLVARRQTDLAQAKMTDIVINLKTTIYRAAQLVTNELAVYYGVTAMGTRAQVVALVEGKHMSLQVANVIMETLESYAKVITALQLKMDKEDHSIRTRDVPSSDPKHEVLKASPQTLASVASCLPRVELIWRLTEGFLVQKSKTGLFASKRNPFISTNPWQEMNVQPK